jgi:transcriptional regulator with XRE-family HTH domain
MDGFPAMLDPMPAQKPPMTVFGARLIAARKARGMTQSQLADAIGTVQQTISLYESTGGNPTADILTKLAKQLDTTVDTLLGISEPPAALANTTEEQRIWRRFRQLLTLPERDRRAVLRMLDSLTKSQQPTDSTG